MTRQVDARDGVRGVPVSVGRSSRGGGHGADDADSFGVGCFAPTVHLYLAPDGDVRACCRNWRALGNIGREPLRDIWNGVRHRDLVARLARDDYSLGCGRCHAEVEIEGREGSYPELFDSFASQLTPGDAPQWPLRMEFNLSNACNLQCIQCDGLLSSSIRIHREGRAPLPKVYGDEFFDDLRAFIPHLNEAQFAGGEPFLGSENYRVWDLIHELQPGLACVSVTNATQWNARVQRVLDQLRMGFIFSIDGVTKTVYEAIRIDADFDSVMTNVDRYAEAARAKEMPLEVNHCLMVQNYRGFADVLEWADSKGIKANVSVVRTPAECSLAALPQSDLREVLRLYDAQDDAVRSRLTINAAAWTAELERIRSWVGSDDSARESLWWDTTNPQQPLDNSAQILMFDRRGGGPVDVAGTLAGLAILAEGRPIHEIDVGNGDVVVHASEALLTELGVEREMLVGQPPDVLQGMVVEHYGPIESWDTVSEDPDGLVLVLTLESARLHVALVPVRDEAGWLDLVRIVFVDLAADPPSVPLGPPSAMEEPGRRRRIGPFLSRVGRAGRTVR